VEGISSARFEYVGLMKPGMVSPDMGRDEVEELRREARSRDLKPLATWGVLQPGEKGISDFEKVIDIAEDLGIGTILTAGPWPYLEGVSVKKPTSKWIKEVEDFFGAMEVVAEHAASKGVEIALKPHAGITGTAKECLETMERIGSRSVRIWYDPANVVYYEGLRPEDTPDDLCVVADFVTGLCAKDIIGGRGGEITAPGKGRIDFGKLFEILECKGFEGPCLVETAVPANTPPEDVDAIVKSSLEYLKGVAGQTPP
ncbi:MAG: sugar phosphate isomerase/epimerase, partial [Candidatus Brockarchaeota archaeon]|nr:sugar phosphate isomerase/epimerase [Candidatus Brockarchaeota archaeon]